MSNTKQPTLEYMERPKLTRMPSEYLFGNLSCSWFIVLLLISFCFAPAFGAWTEHTALMQLREQGVVVEGEVAHLYITTSDNNKNHHVIYEYEAIQSGGPTTFTQDEIVSFDIYERLEFGGRVNVIYAEDDPAFARVEQNLQIWWFNPLYMLIGLSVAFIVVFFTGLLMGIRSWRWAKKLAAEGVVTEATIFDRWAQKASNEKDNKTILYCVAYRFEASLSDGRTEQVSRSEINPWAYANFEIGAVTQVRYLRERPEICRLEYDKNIPPGRISETPAIYRGVV